MNQILDFLNNNIGLVTILVGFLAYGVYWKQNRDNKKDAAKIILQEIRRAEDIISDYKENGQYHFTKKIIATNSWAKNIHHFVGNLDADELDKISNLYSTGEYLDSIITKVSDFKFDDNINQFKNIFQQQLPIKPVEMTAGSNVVNIPVPITIQAPWKGLLDGITLKYEPIYHSTIVDKLKKISIRKNK